MNPTALAKGAEASKNLADFEEEEAALVASVLWLASTDLGFPAPSHGEKRVPLCSSKACLKKGTSQCARCHGASYCSKECQVSDWKGGHKQACVRIRRIVNGREEPNLKAGIVRLLRRIRMYMVPFLVANEATATEKGFVFLQTSNPVDEFVLLGTKVNPKTGETYSRSVVLQYLTLPEFTANGRKAMLLRLVLNFLII